MTSTDNRKPLPLPGGQSKVLLHSCCAPCSGEVMEAMVASGIDFTIFFYNPNIHPRKEYELRKDENIRFAEKFGILFVDADYDRDNCLTGSNAHAGWRTSRSGASAAPCASTCASSEISKRENFYQQEYCGCVYSLRDTNQHRLESGRERIQLGVKFYGHDDSTVQS